MNTVSVEGVVYTKVSVLAKKYGYTTDYIGQLCRSGKVECQLVGRTWYVTDTSLLVHKNAKYGKTRSSEIPFENNVNFGNNEQNEQIDVRPVMTRNSAKLFANSEQKSKGNEYIFSPAKYEPDSVDLLPHAKRQVNSTHLAVVSEMEEDKNPTHQRFNHDDQVSEVSTKIKIISETKPKKLGFTDVPEVSLSGSIKVNAVEVPLKLQKPLPPPPKVLHENDAVLHKATSVELSAENSSVVRQTTATATVVAVVIFLCGAVLSFVSLTATNVSVVSSNASASTVHFDLTALSIFSR